MCCRDAMNPSHVRLSLQASRLPGGVPMNGNLAPVFLQRRPKDAGLPIDGHGVPSKVRDL